MIFLIFSIITPRAGFEPAIPKGRAYEYSFDEVIKRFPGTRATGLRDLGVNVMNDKRNERAERVHKNLGVNID